MNVTVIPFGVSGLTTAEAKRIRASRRPERADGTVYKTHACPNCGAPISARYAAAGYVCDSCADIAEGLKPGY